MSPKGVSRVYVRIPAASALFSAAFWVWLGCVDPLDLQRFRLRCGAPWAILPGTDVGL